MFEQKKITYKMKLLSSLAKVFQDEEPVYQMECQTLSALWGETVSFQAAYTGDFFMRERLDVEVVSPLKDYIRVRTVEQVPVGRATNGIALSKSFRLYCAHNSSRMVCGRSENISPSSYIR